MKQAFEKFKKMLIPGGHGIILCSSLQYIQWYHALVQYRRGEEPCDKPVQHTKRMRAGQILQTEEPVMIVVKRRGTFSSRVHLSFGNSNVYEGSIHFWKPSGRVRDQTRFNYTVRGQIDDMYPRWGNVMTEIPAVRKP